jgi:hypothetical protein
MRNVGVVVHLQHLLLRGLRLELDVVIFKRLWLELENGGGPGRDVKSFRPHYIHTVGGTNPPKFKPGPCSYRAKSSP